MTNPEVDYSEITSRLDSISTRLDLIVYILLDILPEEKFQEGRRFTHKVGRLDSTGIVLRPVDAGKIFGRPSKDISSRRREVAAAQKKKKRNSKRPKTAKQPGQVGQE